MIKEDQGLRLRRPETRVVRCLLHAPPVRHSSRAYHNHTSSVPPTPLAVSFACTMTKKHWLMKAEPDSRIVKGKDVKVRSQRVTICARVPTKRPSLVSMTSRQLRQRLGRVYATQKRGT